jgi:cell division transport system permease protein
VVQRIRYLVRDACTNLLRSGWGGLASVGTISVAFLIVGVFLLLADHLQGLLATWREQFQVTVFLEDGITPDQFARLKRRIGNELAVRSFTYTSKEEALANFKREMRGQEALLEGLGDNPLPASFQLRIRPEAQTVEGMKQLAAALSRLEGVEDVAYGRDWFERLATAARVMRIVGLSVGTLLLAASVLIVSSTVRLAVHARAAEIEIMRLVGATNMYIRAPFVLEGMLQGALGAGLALALLYGAQRLAYRQLPPDLVASAGPAFLTFLDPHASTWIVAAGALLGALGSLLSVGRFLRV